jgi:hypothetical protein
MQHHVIGVLVAGILAAACSAPQPNTEGAAASGRQLPQELQSLPPGGPAGAVPTAADSARTLYWSFVRSLGDSRVALIRRLGAPSTTTGDTLRNGFDTTIVDSLVALRYPGIVVEFFVGAGGNEFPTVVSVTDSTIELPLPVGVGSSRTALIRTFGAPDYEIPQGASLALQFAVPGPVENHVVFVMVDGVARKVQWVYYVD